MRTPLAAVLPALGSAVGAGLVTALALTPGGAAAPLSVQAQAPQPPVAALPAGSYAPMPPNLQVAETDGGLWRLTISVPLNRPNATGQNLTMHVWDCSAYAFCNTTATPGVDYEPVDATLVWAPKQQVATVVLRLRGDRTVEPNELVDLRFDGSTGPWNLPVAWDNNTDVLVANDD